MKKTNKILQTVFYTSLTISLIMVILFECNIIDSGLYAAYGKNEFIVATTMELITIFAIPLMLGTFKFGFVKRSVCRGGDKSLHSWSLMRMMVLCILMVINTLLYYVFMNVAFGDRKSVV